MLYFNVQTAFRTSEKTPMKFASLFAPWNTIQAMYGEFAFGGQKESVDAPPNNWSKLVQLVLDPLYN